MKYINETIDLNVTKRTDGAKPIKLSEFIKTDTYDERYSIISNYFGENDSNKFSYTKFKSFFRVSIKRDTPFNFGFENAKKLDAFGELIENPKSSSNDKSTIVYDEYIETFFIYLYYEVFIRISSSYNDIIVKNAEGVKKAKEILSNIKDDSLRNDVTLGLQKTFLSLMGVTISDYTSGDVKKDNKARSEYIEEFINKNINIFRSYPISSKFSSAFDKQTNQSSSVGKIVDALFDVCVDFQNSDEAINKQVKIISLLSNFIGKKGAGLVDFDVSLLSKSEYNLESPPSFSTKSTPLANEVINALCNGISDQTLETAGLGWAKNSKWNVFIKLLSGIFCLSQINENIQKVASTLNIKGMEYTPLLDTTEKDGGIHFINNMAFYYALRESSDSNVTNLISNLNSMIELITYKANYFLDKKGPSWTTSILIDYDDKYKAPLYKELNDAHKNCIKNILSITNADDTFGNNPEDAIAKINEIFYNVNKDVNNSNIPDGFLRDSILYAARNCADYIIEDVMVSGDISNRIINTVLVGDSINFYKDIVFTGAPALISKISDDISNSNFLGIINDVVEAWDGVKNKYFKIGEVIDNKTKEEGFTVKLNGKDIYSIKTVEDFKKMVTKLSQSVGSMLCHGLVMFAKSGDNAHNDKDEMEKMYKKYYNDLSFLVLEVSKDNPNEYSTGGYDLATRITPFSVEVLKYTLRGFINNIHKMKFINPDLRDKIEKANEKDKLTSGEWRVLAVELQREIEKNFGEKLKLKERGMDDKDLSGPQGQTSTKNSSQDSKSGDNKSKKESGTQSGYQSGTQSANGSKSLPKRVLKK